MDSLAPIIIFAFNRPQAFQALTASLLANEECKDSDLYIYIDGARASHPQDKEKVEETAKIAHSIKGFRSITIEASAQNNGLAASIIKGVTEVIDRHGQAIVMEDDLVVSRNFLAYMNQGLRRYINQKKVFSICGYTNKVTPPHDYGFDSYFTTRSSSWGWGTWKDRWATVDWELADWKTVKANRFRFNRWGGSDCYGLLDDWHTGRNHSWAIRFCYSQFIQDRVSSFPIISKVQNRGFDGSGTHCKAYTRFKSEFDESDSKAFEWPVHIFINKSLERQSARYSSLSYRIFCKIKNITKQFIRANL